MSQCLYPTATSHLSTEADCRTVADIYSHYAKEYLVFNASLVFFQLSFLQDNDGGMTAQLPSTITSFVQTGLRPGEEYTVNLVALRDQGRSQPVTATVITCMY